MINEIMHVGGKAFLKMRAQYSTVTTRRSGDLWEFLREELCAGFMV